MSGSSSNAPEMNSPDNLLMPQLIAEGRAHYEAGRHKRALEPFTVAMLECSCNRGTKRKRCSCKNYENPAAPGGSLFQEAMYTCSCDVGKSFHKCDNALHIQALDFRASTFEVLGQLEKARRDAEWMLELAPRRPDGYLRLGKILRLQRRPDIAWNIYNAGIEAHAATATTTAAQFQEAKVQQLFKARQQLQKHFAKRDPLDLPADIVHLILKNLDLWTVTQCTRVSKTWHRVLTSVGYAWLWRSLNFFKTWKHGVTKKTLLRLLSYSRNDVREVKLKYRDGIWGKPDKVLLLLNGAPNLERFECDYHDSFEKHNTRFSSLDESRFSKLRQLVLYAPCPGTRDPASDTYVHSLFDVPLPSLEHLDIQCIFLQPMLLDASRETRMPNLTRLKLSRLLNIKTLPLSDLVASTPLLEQLMLSEVYMDSSSDFNPEEQHWPHLKVFMVQDLRNHAIIKDYTRKILSINQGRNLRVIVLDINVEELNMHPQPAPVVPKFQPLLDNRSSYHISPYGEPCVGYDNLRSVRLCRTVLDPRKMRSCLTNALKNGTLHTVDVVSPQPVLRGPNVNYLDNFQWLRGEKSIRCIGIHDFVLNIYSGDTSVDSSLISFLLSFPNLDTVDISVPDGRGFACGFVEALILKTQIKTIYFVHGEGDLHRLSALACARGVTLHISSMRNPWPALPEDLRP